MQSSQKCVVVLFFALSQTKWLIMPQVVTNFMQKIE